VDPIPNGLSDGVQASRALALLDEAYRTRPRRPGRTPRHPIEVAGLLLADGQPETVVVAGLLHDVLEDTDVTPDELVSGFGSRISGMVHALTEDPSISAYRPRKAALRRQIMESSPETVAVSLADKTAKLLAADQRPRARKLEHYRATLDEAERRFGPTPGSDRLHAALARWS